MSEDLTVVTGRETEIHRRLVREFARRHPIGDQAGRCSRIPGPWARLRKFARAYAADGARPCRPALGRQQAEAPPSEECA